MNYQDRQRVTYCVCGMFFAFAAILAYAHHVVH